MEGVATLSDIQPAMVEQYADELLKLENQLCFPLYVCSKEVVHRYAPFLKELGITYTQYITLMALWEHDSVSIGELGERLYLDTGTLTPLLKKLEEKGLVNRVRSADDERRVDITLTDAGRSLKQRAAMVPVHMGRCVNLTPDEALELKRLLSKVIESVGER